MTLTDEQQRELDRQSGEAVDRAVLNRLASGTRFCSDCEYFRPALTHQDWASQMRYARCARTAKPSLVHPNLPVGLDAMEMCASERALPYEPHCSPDGAFWKVAAND